MPDANPPLLMPPPEDDVEAIRASRLFDAEWYQTTYPDVKALGMDPAEHYLWLGVRLKRNPSPAFDSAEYLRRNSEVAARGYNPLLHYERWGKEEARLTAVTPSENSGSVLTHCDAIRQTPSTGSDYVFKLESLTAEQVRGWCVDKRDPGRIFSIDLLVDGLLFRSIQNNIRRKDLQLHAISSGHGGMQAALPLGLLDTNVHTVSLRLPNGATHTATVSSTRKQRPRVCQAVCDAKTSIVVPVYNAADDLAVCIERIAAYTPGDTDVLFVDDASPDPRIAAILDHAVTRPNMRALRNETNLGFVRSVNRGLSETGRNDVIILNSDARVTPGWFDGMRAAAYSGPRIATVTAMSDRAGAFSAPKLGNDNDLPPGVDEITYARAFRRRSLGLYPDVPTGNGFCMFISRACMEEIGLLDAEAFPRGYCEENDFCMRAGRAGWRSIIDDRTYVFHDRSKSFGADKTELMAAHRKVIDERYPEYGKAIAVFSEGPLICLARYQARRALVDCGTPSASLPRALYVVSTQTGGTPQTNRDLMGALGDVLEAFVLRCDSRMLELSQFRDGALHELRKHQLREPIDPITHVSFEYDAVVADWLRDIDVDLVHIRHLAWHSLSLPRVAKAAGKKVVFSFHDFYTLCPTTKLLDDTGTFCGGRCTASDGHCRAELWSADALPALKHSWVHVWREKFTRALAPCDAFVTTSHSARARILEHLPGVPEDRFRVIPHGRDFAEFARLRQTPVRGEPLRILLPGNISTAKGLDIVHKLIERDSAGLLEFHVLGGLDTAGRAPHPRLHEHGRYARDEFAHKVAPLRPHLGAMFSIWDETYCHTLTELWSVGLPVVVFDFPTVADRVRASGAGWVMDHKDIGALYDEILRVAFDSDEQNAKIAALANWQETQGSVRTNGLMAVEYLDVYRSVMRHAAPYDARTEATACVAHHSGAGRPRIAVVYPASEPRNHGLASAEARIGERTRNRLDRDVTYLNMAPASLLANLRAGEIDGAILHGDVVSEELAPSLRSALAEAAVPYLFDLGGDPASMDDGKAELLRELIGGAAVVTAAAASDIMTADDLLDRRAVPVPDLLSRSLWRGVSPERRPDGLLRGLWIGSATDHADFEMVCPAIEGIARDHPEFRLAIVGAVPQTLADWAERIDVSSDLSSHARYVHWLRSLVSELDFAIAPLSDTAGNAGRSALKILEYGALGLPILASDVSPFRTTTKAAIGIEWVTNTTAGWTAALRGRVALGAGNRTEGASLRRWVLDTHALEPSLSEFDGLVLSMLG